VRVPVELKSDSMILRTAALANSGYEAEEPEVHIPIALAKKLGFKLEDVRGERYGVVGVRKLLLSSINFINFSHLNNPNA
jgi:hypothetical protein